VSQHVHTVTFNHRVLFVFDGSADADAGSSDTVAGAELPAAVRSLAERLEAGQPVQLDFEVSGVGRRGGDGNGDSDDDGYTGIGLAGRNSVWCDNIVFAHVVGRLCP
jgi:hypothetical protein